MSIATQLGVPVACMAVMSMAVWRVCVWAGTHIAMPLVDAHIHFLKTVEMELHRQTEAYNVQSVILQEMNGKLAARQH